MGFFGWFVFGGFTLGLLRWGFLYHRLDNYFDRKIAAARDYHTGIALVPWPDPVRCIRGIRADEAEIDYQGYKQQRHDNRIFQSSSSM